MRAHFEALYEGRAFAWCPWIPGTLMLDSILSLFKCGEVDKVTMSNFFWGAGSGSAKDLPEVFRGGVYSIIQITSFGTWG